MKSHIITVGKVETHYWTLGEPGQPPIILLHGIKGTHLGLMALAKRLSGYYVILPDMPSHGESGDLTTAHTYEAMAQWLVAFVDELKLKQPIIGGHSLGGMIAAVAASERQNLARKLVLIVPVTNQETRLVRVLDEVYSGVDHLPEHWQRFLLANSLFRYMICRINLVTKDKAVWQKQYDTEKLEASMYRPVAVKELREDLSRHDFTKIAQRIKVPTLVIAASNDALSTPDSQQRFAEALPKGELELVEQAGHFIQIEKTATLAELIKGFIDDETA